MPYQCNRLRGRRRARAGGKIQAVLDITTHEWGGFLFDGLMKCGPERFSHIYNSEIP
ncbi:MAG: Tm-1-like ATP-binding domain-containing protein [Oscillospiraceae bacterium]